MSLVRPAEENLKQLAAKINAEHEAGERTTRKGLEHFRAAGELLLRAKRQCGHGNWLAWLKANVSFSQATASNHMRLATNWDKLKTTFDFHQSLNEALRRITGAADDRPAEASVATQEPPAAARGDDDQDGVPAVPDDAQELPADKRPRVTLNTGENEWYTPPEYLEAARAVLGQIDLDPASSDIAQRVVRATTYFTKESDGLAQQWRGKVWLNPPYARGLIEAFVVKLCEHFEAGDVPEAIVLTNNATETQWFQPLAAHATAICFPDKRVRFLDVNGEPGAPTQGQAVFYLGTELGRFTENFGTFGLVFVRQEK